ncbi:anthranilate synthase component I [Psychromonas sp. B3M02]|uniref:anthranilate synthase component 1 n=1 Tax=Psychromonas sp. B3M02 TaxID=2267226 RepID=UPI000DE88ADB|nr:anthranilate synthase component 1 [Psychromonas sp. B3M02]RBW41325.1 anthranilate synthase component I [Psychromonas sp. B3M02]
MNTHHPIGTLKTIEAPCHYIQDSLGLFQKISANSHHHLLFDSAEIESKAHLKSLILVDACLKITCQGLTVTLDALTDNGKDLLTFITPKFSTQLITAQRPSQLQLTFPQSDTSGDEDQRLKSASPMDAIRCIVERIKKVSTHPEALFLGGVFAYDFIATFEQLLAVPDGENTTPDYLFYVAETLMLHDHQTQQGEVLGSVFGGLYSDESEARIAQRIEQLQGFCTDFIAPVNQQVSIDATVKVDISDEEYCDIVEELKTNIVKGDIFQVVPSRSFSLPCPDPISAYQKLKETNPSPYMFYLKDSDFVLFGASPESAIKYTQSSGDVEIYPIAGTRRRGFNADGSINKDLDGRLELELRLDKKETSEHLMLVDLARNDVARISQPGTRHVADLLQVDRYSHVMHLVSRVVGKLREDLDALHAYQACMNMGTLVGAPKISASNLVRKVEKKRRGSYGGAVGYINGNGDMDSCIVIRSAFVKDGVAHAQAGAGVVYDSVPQLEADETRSKAAAVLNAVALAHGTTLKAVTANATKQGE